MSEKFYILSEAADQDLEDIFNFTLHKFGFDQAEKYLLEIDLVFQNLIVHPELGKRRNEIKEDLYRQSRHFLSSFRQSHPNC